MSLREPGEPLPDAASGHPRTWHPYCEVDGSDVVSPELRDAIKPPDRPDITESELLLRVSQVKTLLRRARAGTLRVNDWKPVSRDPELWEVRWRWDDGTLVRGYFHEPPLEPDSTVLARVHLKEVVPDDDRATNKLQDEQIDAGGFRIRRGRDHHWGLGSSTALV